MKEEEIKQFLQDGGKFFRGAVAEGDFIFIPGGWLVGHRSMGSTLSLGIRCATFNTSNYGGFLSLIGDYSKSTRANEDMKRFMSKIASNLMANKPRAAGSEVAAAGSADSAVAAAPTGAANAAPAPPLLNMATHLPFLSYTSYISKRGPTVI